MEEEREKELTLRRESDKCLGETFLDRYTAWAHTRTDAPIQYHTLGAVVILSTLMSPQAVLPMSHGELRPNIWVMILAGTTITRKSTSMDMVMTMLNDCNDDYLMATDGSPEGILTELAFRDGKVSLFHRDEITGFIENARNRDYMAGLLETFTRLYDGRREKRILRREAIEIKAPRFVILCGGIRTRMQQITGIELIRSGFIPRFLIVSGSTSVDEMKEIGPPPTSESTEDPREIILKELLEISQFWSPVPNKKKVTIAGLTKIVEEKPKDLTMSATPQAWERIRQMQRDAIKLGESSHSPEIFLPMYQRLGYSILKISMMLCGAERRTQITFKDVCTAIAYSDIWLRTATEFAQAVEDEPDIGPWEKKAQKVISYIRAFHPLPVTRSEVMRRFHVQKQHIQNLEDTLVARGEIRVTMIDIGRTKKDGSKTVSGKARTEYSLTGKAAIRDETYRARLLKEAEIDDNDGDGDGD
jgi:hypothetical protein